MKPITHYDEISDFITKDDSVIRELMHPSQHLAKHQSLAEATVAVHNETQLHMHLQTEEIYHITQGTGLMTWGDELFTVSPGDTICIPPGTAHKIRNTGSDELKILCCCSPAYADLDTVLI